MNCRLSPAGALQDGSDAEDLLPVGLLDEDAPHCYDDSCPPLLAPTSTDDWPNTAPAAHQSDDCWNLRVHEGTGFVWCPSSADTGAGTCGYASGMAACGLQAHPSMYSSAALFPPGKAAAQPPQYRASRGSRRQRGGARRLWGRSRTKEEIASEVEAFVTYRKTRRAVIIPV